MNSIVKQKKFKKINDRLNLRDENKIINIIIDLKLKERRSEENIKDYFNIVYPNTTLKEYFFQKARAILIKF